MPRCWSAPPLSIVAGAAADALGRLGLGDFDALWRLPHEFVEAPNHRRAGWSAVVRAGSGGHVFYVKRQENQCRRSLRHPLGRPSFVFEAESLQQWRQAGLPVVELVAHGCRRRDGVWQAVLVTAAVPPNYRPLLDLRDRSDPWPPAVLRRVGEQLCGLHAAGWRHGSLYPGHVYVDPASGELLLIDLERARRHRRAESAALSDLRQFLRRCTWLSCASRTTLLAAYRERMPAVFECLGSGVTG
ncbi:MAG: hypothetical protein CALGDGBN_02151 [Pseudomonadales bacterium]|nr:hypothetical protein [Pseudomonadales bacterium]